MDKNIEILIIEDESIIINFIINGLKKFGYKNFRFAFDSQGAIKEIIKKPPAIILMDISLERKYSGIYLENIINKKYKIPVIFITGGVDRKTGDLIEKSACFGVLFKPFKMNTLRITIKMAIEKHEMVMKMRNNSTILEDKLREINTFYSVSKLMDRNGSIDSILNEALDIIPYAFRFGSQISLRITYKNRQYLSKNFKETKWVLSEGICKDRRDNNLVELYLDIRGEKGKFPFNIGEIETFTSIVKQLSLTIDKKEFDIEVKRQLAIQEFTVNILHHLINNFDISIQNFAKLYLINIKEKFNYKNVHVVTFRLDELHIRKYSLIKEKEGCELIDIDFLKISKKIIKEENINYLYFNSGKDGKYRSLPYTKNMKLELKNRSIVIVPVKIRSSIIALIVLEIDGKENFLVNEEEYILLGEVFSLGINKLNREKKINTYKQAIEQNPASVVITDLDGIITYVNPGFTEVTGYKYEEVMGHTSRILKSGYQNEEFYSNLWHTIQDGRIWKGTFQNKRKNGEIFWEEAYINPIKDDHGVATGYIAVKKDITEKINADNKLLELNRQLKETQASLVMEEKLASIGRLAAGIAHELNNPIGFIYSNFRTIKKYFGKYQNFIIELSQAGTYANLDTLLEKNKLKYIEEDMKDLLSESSEGFERVINIINSLRSFSRVDQLKSSVRFNFNDALKATLTVARNQIKYAAEIEINFAEIPDIYCNSSEINQVLLNIILNAVQAIKSFNMERKGKIIISTFANENWVSCKIEDNGPGIPNDIIQNIFEPFFTTKPVGEGTGLGLNISYDIVVNKHKGELLAGNNEHGGAYFIINLPLVTAEEKDDK